MIVFYHYESLMTFKSVPQKRNYDFTGKYPYIRAGTLRGVSEKGLLVKMSLIRMSSSVPARI